MDNNDYDFMNKEYYHDRSSEFYLISEVLDEYPWDMMDRIYDNGKISIWSSPSTEHLWYFKVFDHDRSKFCRISMTEPKILSYLDETLILTRDDVNEIIYALTEFTIHDKNGWYWIIYEYNITGPHFPIPEDLPMPDYSLLKEDAI